MYIPKSVRKKLDNAELGKKVYFRRRNGLVYEFQKVQATTVTGEIIAPEITYDIRIRCLTPTRKPLPLVIKVDPPKPFKDWKSYHKSCDLKKE